MKLLMLIVLLAIQANPVFAHPQEPQCPDSSNNTCSSSLTDPKTFLENLLATQYTNEYTKMSEVARYICTAKPLFARETELVPLNICEWPMNRDSLEEHSLADVKEELRWLLCDLIDHTRDTEYADDAKTLCKFVDPSYTEPYDISTALEILFNKEYTTEFPFYEAINYICNDPMMTNVVRNFQIGFCGDPLLWEETFPTLSGSDLIDTLQSARYNLCDYFPREADERGLADTNDLVSVKKLCKLIDLHEKTFSNDNSKIDNIMEYLCDKSTIERLDNTETKSFCASSDWIHYGGQMYNDMLSFEDKYEILDNFICNGLPKALEPDEFPKLCKLLNKPNTNRYA